jgi:hypothetical protein
MFLDDVGFNANWEQGVQSHWQGELGQHVFDVELDNSTMGRCTNINNNTYTDNDKNDNNNADAELYC